MTPRFLSLYFVGFMLASTVLSTLPPSQADPIIQNHSTLRRLAANQTCFTSFSSVLNIGSGGRPPASTDSISQDLGVLGVLVTSALRPLDTKFQQFLDEFKPKDDFQKGSSQFIYRALVFKQNLNKINTHNLNTNRRYSMGLNKFADLTSLQFNAQYAKLSIPDLLKKKIRKINSPDVGKANIASIASESSVTSNSAQTYTTPPNISIDWSCKASPVVNQGVCGSCFAIAPLESIYITTRIYGQSILPLSFQEILSCSDSHNGAYGCSGGYFISAYQYNRVNGTGRSIMYPYNSKAFTDGVVTPCNTTILNSPSYKNSKFKIRQAGFIPNSDCEALVNKLKTQALAVSIATTGFQFYVNGTYNVAGQLPNHGVTLVGYSPTLGYRIKNSWGATWGDSGYAYVSQTTGVCDYAMYPVTGFEGLDMNCC